MNGCLQDIPILAVHDFPWSCQFWNKASFNSSLSVHVYICFVSEYGNTNSELRNVCCTFTVILRLLSMEIICFLEDRRICRLNFSTVFNLAYQILQGNL